MIRAWALRSAAFLSVVLLNATVAYSRAGGGGGYSSGGGSSSSYSSSTYSGSSSGGSAAFTLFDAIVMALVIGALVMAARRAKRKRAERLRALEKRSRECVTQLETRDPSFNLVAFTKRIEAAFLQIQDAWSNQDLESVRGFMSDGLHERFSVQLREQKQLGYRNRLSDVRILEAHLVEVETLDHFDTVSVRITARAKDIRVDLRSDQIIAGSGQPETFVEVWRFLRGRDFAQSEMGLFEGQCPNCAGPLDPERSWECERCDSKLDGAPPDWVLTEITQQSEWVVKDRKDRPWMKAATQQDPGLTEAQLEDRASVLFWRLMDSASQGDTTELTGISRPLFLERQTRLLTAQRDRFVGDVAVGAVRLHGIIPGKKWDLALIEIRWAGAGFTRASKTLVTETGTRSLYRHLLVMARAAGTKSDVGRCIVSAHCTQCGAPDEGALDGKCGFCGAVLNSGNDWLIERFLPLDRPEASILLAEVGRPSVDERNEGGLDRESDASATVETSSAPGSTELYAWCLRLLYADQHIDRRERKGLEQLAERLLIRPEQARKLRQAAQFGRLEVETPPSRREAKAWLDELSAMAELDGRLDRRETQILVRLSRLIDTL